MPEGPSLVILKEELQPFKGKKIIEVTGNSKENISQLKGRKIEDFKTWGKHFLICFKDITLRIHFMLFGKYSINEKKPTPVRIGLQFIKGEINFYNCSVRFIAEPLDEVYDFTADVMNEEWNPRSAKKKLKEKPTPLFVMPCLTSKFFQVLAILLRTKFFIASRYTRKLK